MQQLGEIVDARMYFEQGIALDRKTWSVSPTNVSSVGIDARVGLRTHAGRTLWITGYPDQAMSRDREATALAEQRSHPYSQVFALGWSATLYVYLRKGQISQAQSEAAVRLAQTHKFEGFLPWSIVMAGWARGIQGDYENGIDQIQQGMSDAYGSGSVTYRAFFLYLLAEVYGSAGLPDKGLDAIAEALNVMETGGDQHCKAELYRLQGELLQRVESRSQYGELTPEACFHQALDIARHQQAKSFELRAAMSLARLWQSQDRHGEAYELLTPVYEWFTEGFDTADVVDARTLLDDLSEGQP